MQQFARLFLLCISLNVWIVSFGKTIPRTKINFDEGWKFHLGHAADPVKDFNFRIAPIFAKSGNTSNTALGVSYNDKEWRTLDLPHDWAVELPF